MSRELQNLFKEFLDTGERQYAERVCVRRVNRYEVGDQLPQGRQVGDLKMTCVVEKIFSNPGFDINNPNPDYYINNVWIAPSPGSRYVNVPSVNCMGVIVYLDKQTAYLALFDGVEEMIHESAGGGAITVQQNVRITNQGDDFRELMIDLVNVVKSLRVNTAWGPSDIPLIDNQTELDNIINRINNLL